MSTLISWSDEVWNPTTGCDRVSPGCANCYALHLAARYRRNPKMQALGIYQRDGGKASGPGFGLTLRPEVLEKPLHWRCQTHFAKLQRVLTGGHGRSILTPERTAPPPMATAPARPCSNPRCWHVQPCPVHQSGPFANAHRSSNLYASARWQRVRRAQLAADPYCRACRAEGRLTLATVADHIEPHNGDERAFWANTLQSLCKRHSNAKTGRETRERARW